MQAPSYQYRNSHDRPMSIMGFPILVRQHLYIESGPRSPGQGDCWEGRRLGWAAAMVFCDMFTAISRTTPTALHCCHMSITASQITRNSTVCSGLRQNTSNLCIAGPF